MKQCRLIHPQNRSGEPTMNPNGKYFVSFNLNGCRRKVIIISTFVITCTCRFGWCMYSICTMGSVYYSAVE